MKNKIQTYIRPLVIELIHTPNNKKLPVLVTMKCLKFLTNQHNKQVKPAKKYRKFYNVVMQLDVAKCYLNDIDLEVIDSVINPEKGTGNNLPPCKSMMDGYDTVASFSLLSSKSGWYRKKNCL
ncbi:hypothetical protein ABN214_14805 [Proteus terrae]|uniref:hypothetical protein n=1 Tax=Proteus terrae TaxID=1574161 RepID=UPI0032DABC79